MSKDFVDKLRNGILGGDFHQGRKAGSRQQGAMQGIVTNNVDPEDRYRVKVKFPWLEDKEESYWCQIGSSMAGNDFGAFSLPEVEDVVIVSFLDGDPERPFIHGSAWNGDDLPPQEVTYTPDDITDSLSNKSQGGKNDFRLIRSRNMSHLVFKDREGEGLISLRTVGKAELVLDDKGGSEKVQLYDHNRNQWLEIDVPNKKITLQTDTGDMLIKALKTITIDCKDLVVKAGKTIKVESGTSSEWKAGSSIKWKAGAAANYESGSATTVKGSKIDLNP